MQVVQEYNENDDVHGILVQLPLPKHINEQRILDAISLEKDVDGFHPFNIGSLAMRGRQPLYTSCTPKVTFCVTRLANPRQCPVQTLPSFLLYRVTTKEGCGGHSETQNGTP